LKHFTEAELTDFARNLVPADMRNNMQEHIETGCKKCSQELQLWQNVVSLAKEESGFAPPDDLVRVAKSQFVMSANLSTSRIRLVFDSFLQPEMAGARGSVSARQFLFETDELYIDLRLDSQAERLSLVGQIMDRAQGKQAVHDLPISLLKGTMQLADTKTNQFGEFQLEFDPSADLYISISTGKEQPIFLPLYGIHGRPLNPSGTA